jgi:polyphosphate kinase
VLRDRVRHEILDAYLADNRKARILLRDATYIRAWQAPGKHKTKPPVGAAAFSAQDFLISLAEGKQAATLPPLPAPRKHRVIVGKERSPQ